MNRTGVADFISPLPWEKSVAMLTTSQIHSLQLQMPIYDYCHHTDICLFFFDECLCNRPIEWSSTLPMCCAYSQQTGQYQHVHSLGRFTQPQVFTSKKSRHFKDWLALLFLGLTASPITTTTPLATRKIRLTVPSSFFPKVFAM